MDSIDVPMGLCAPIAPVYDLFPTFPVNKGPVIFDAVKQPEKVTRFLSMAMGVATTSQCKMKHGAIVVKHGHVLGSSPNIWKNDPKNVHYKNSSVHAEIAALRKAGWPKKVDIYVARVNNQGESRLSKPCANCQAVLDEMKIKVIYTV
jgi:deoxycytidylate deaminase